MRLEVGSGCGGFDVVRRLPGAGAMGDVYVVRRPGEADDFALKIIRLEDSDLREAIGESELAARFDREILALSLLNGTPGIVPLVEHGTNAFETSDGSVELPYYVSPFYPDGDLRDHVQSNGPIQGRRAARAFAKVARSLHVAHGRKIIHRDLKPTNLLVGPRQELITCDFGLAALSDGRGLTTFGRGLGTELYASKEQLDGAPVTVKDDIHALARTFWYAMTGVAPPWPASFGELPPLKSLRINRPAFDEVIARATLPRTSRKGFRSMEEFAEALDRLASRRFTPGTRPGAVGRVIPQRTGNSNDKLPPRTPPRDVLEGRIRSVFVDVAANNGSFGLAIERSRRLGASREDVEATARKLRTARLLEFDEPVTHSTRIHLIR